MADLRREIDIDAGFLSRLLARLQRDGLVARERSTDDARRQRVRLTEEGAAAFAELDRRSADEIGAVLDALPEDDQQRLVAAMDTVHDVLTQAPPAGAFVLRSPRPGDLGWIVQRHGALYAQQYGWDESFEALVARIVADYAADHDPRREAAWIAEVDGEPAGCVLCVRREDDVAQLRLLLVEPRARGRGIGARLVEECLRFAQRAGLHADHACGPTTSCTRPAGSTSGPASSSSSPPPTTASATTSSSRPGRGRSRGAAQRRGSRRAETASPRAGVGGGRARAAPLALPLAKMASCAADAVGRRSATTIAARPARTPPRERSGPPRTLPVRTVRDYCRKPVAIPGSSPIPAHPNATTTGRWWGCGLTLSR